ncbi:MAG: formyltransferase family protein [Patescibacteria group bacterium]
MKDLPIKNVILMGRKPGAAQVLEHLIGKGIGVRFVVAPRTEDHVITLRDVALARQIPVFDDEEVYDMISSGSPLVKDVDLVISYLYWNKIKKPLIDLSARGCINFHPAPLPEYKSRAGYNTAILDRKEEFGASAHFIDSEDFDSGPIISVKKFAIDPERETAHSLEKKTQQALFELFQEVIELFLAGDEIVTRPNEGGLYLTQKQLERLKEINPEDSLEDINAKVRAFFFPPYSGAKIKIKGKDFTLIDDDILRYLHELMKSRSL